MDHFYSIKEGIVLYFILKYCHNDRNNISYLGNSHLSSSLSVPKVAPTAVEVGLLRAGIHGRLALYCLQAAALVMFLFGYSYLKECKNLDRLMLKLLAAKASGI